MRRFETRPKTKVRYPWTLIAVALLTIGSVWLSTIVWQECRANGSSFFYCLKVVMR